MITPRRTRLVRVADLHELRHVVATRAGTGRDEVVIVVPTRSAAAQARRMLKQRRVDRASALLLTREELYDLLHARMADPPRRLTELERDAIAQASANEMAQQIPDLPFQIRRGLVGEILRLYDLLRRQSQQVRRFEELIVDALGGGDIDRGADRMLQQTRFLAGTFREYERRVAATGACDEHLLRERLCRETPAAPTRHVVVTVSDWIAEPAGLFVADFDLLSRLPSLESLDAVATEAVLGSGFHERIHTWWPGLEETTGDAIAGAGPRVRPLLVVPEPSASSGSSDRLWFTHRDREEELIACATRLAQAAREEIDRTAIVFKRPLPYLYLAPEVCGQYGMPFQLSDALPLASEPVIAAIDVVLDAVETRFSRAALVALLRSPHFDLGLDAGAPAVRLAIGRFDRALSDARYLGELARLEALAATAPFDGDPLAPVIAASLSVAHELCALLEDARASVHLGRLANFLTRYFVPFRDDHPAVGRERRAGAAAFELLSAMADAHAAHYDSEWSIEDLAGALRRSIGEATFAVETGESGVQVIDDQAARYGDFDEIVVVGLVENDWPERTRRNIFYPPQLLKSLGWPSEKDRRSAADARFLDLLASPTTRVELSTFTLEDESLVTRSLQLDEVPRARLSTTTRPQSTAPRLATVSEWSALRTRRTPAADERFHGAIGPSRERAWAVSALETYLKCPFKFFAQHVLRLEEEPDDEEVMDARRQGQFAHEVFEAFFRAWSESGRREITPANLNEARALFSDVVDGALAQLPEGEAALERTRLLGSPAAAGLGEAVFRMEAERPAPVVERLLEYKLEGPFAIATDRGDRVVQLCGKADRIDLLADGTFRLIDYKLGWPPDRTRALQLPVYSICAEQRLAGRGGRTWAVGEAMYLAFKGPGRVVPLFANGTSRAEVLGKAQQRTAEAIDGIAAGQFPPSPEDVYMCDTCTFAAVCRKDYVGDI